MISSPWKKKLRYQSKYSEMEKTLILLDKLNKVGFYSLEDFHSNIEKIIFPNIKVTFEGEGHTKSPGEDFFCPVQVHDTHLQTIENITDLPQQADASITFSSHTPLAVRTADCLPLVFFDEDEKSPIMGVHAGWKGFAKNIIGHCTEKYFSHLKNNNRVRVIIGPAISRGSFEVGPEVIDAVSNSNILEQEELYSCIQKGLQDRWHIDLQQAACLQLISLGIAPENISVIRECTFLKDRWHSFRRESKLCGHNFTVIEKLNPN